MPPKKQPAPRQQPPRPIPPYAANAPEVVDPRWLLTAGALMLGVALLFAYTATCILFYKAQWQLVLKPSHTEAHKPADYGLTADAVSFGPDVSGQPQLRGWWLPDAPASPTALLLPSGDGSAGDWLARAKMLHDAHLNVLLFDYRGAGASLGGHPTEMTMEADSESAIAYLNSRGIPNKFILPYGVAQGSPLAVRLAAIHPDLPVLILENPEGDFADRARVDPRAKPVPFDMLFHENFPLAAPLKSLATPKLILSTKTLPANFTFAGDPKMLVTIPVSNEATAIPAALSRFLDQYVRRPPETLVPGNP